MAVRGGRRRWWVLGVLMAMALSLVGVGWSATHQRYSSARAQENLCDDYFALKYALLSSSVLSEGTLRFRVARLAREARFASSAEQRDARPANTAAALLEEALTSPIVSRSDVYTRLRPVAVACGDPIRTYLNFEPRPQEDVAAGLWPGTGPPLMPGVLDGQSGTPSAMAAVSSLVT